MPTGNLLLERLNPHTHKKINFYVCAFFLFERVICCCLAVISFFSMLMVSLKTLSHSFVQSSCTNPLSSMGRMSKLTMSFRHLWKTKAPITAAPSVVLYWDLRPEGPHWWGLFILKVTRFSVSLCFIMGSKFSWPTVCTIDFTLADHYPFLETDVLWFYT